MHPATTSISPGAASPQTTSPKITCIMPMSVRLPAQYVRSLRPSRAAPDGPAARVSQERHIAGC